MMMDYLHHNLRFSIAIGDVSMFRRADMKPFSIVSC